MSDEDAGLQRLRAAMARELPPVPFVGAGFSSAVTGDAACATWNGMLRSGIDVCAKQVPGPPPSWAKAMKALLEDADAGNYLTVAEGISERLRPVLEGREFNSWLESTVGKLAPAPGGRELIVALCGLGDIIVTTNYDTLIERSQTAWTPCTWKDPDYATADLRKDIVLHLHGVIDKPESIIFGKTDYGQLETELYQSLHRAFFARRDFIFIGCGAGLADPHIGPLLDFIDRVMPKGSAEYFILIKQDELEQYGQRQLSQKITPVPYQDLLQVLRDIAPPDKAEAAPDPPPAGEQRAGDGPGTGLLDDARKAEQITKGTTGLEAEARRLLAQAETARDDLGDRVVECDDYQDPYDALVRAHAAIGRAHAIATGLHTALIGLVPAAEPESEGRARRTARPDGPGASSVRSRGPVSQDAWDVPDVGPAAAGASNIPVPDEHESVSIPPQSALKKDVIAVEVNGDSMTVEDPRRDDDLRDGDYVIVDKGREHRDGEIAVVRTGFTDADVEMRVKRVWREGDSFRLQSANLSYEEERVGREENAHIVGPVIGVFRRVKPRRPTA